MLLLLGFLVLNLLTSTRYPFVAGDEVTYSDPAVNLYLGKGFTSTVWFAQSADEFWAGNVPLHPLLLYVWLKLFGLSILSVRSINYVYMAVNCWLVWRFCVRLNLIASARLRLLLLGLILSGFSVVFSYRSGRPDCLAMLIICLFLPAHTLRRTGLVLGSFFLLGCVAPWAGLQLLPLLAVGGILLFLYLGKSFLPRVLAAWFGAAVGLGSLFFFYFSHNVLPQFLTSVRWQANEGFFQALNRGEFRHSNLLPKDFSFAALFLLALVVAAWQMRKGTFQRKSMLSFGLVYSVALSLALIASAKFPTYYGWMTYLPLNLCLCASFTTLKRDGGPVRLSRALIAAALLAGIPLNAFNASLNWADRDYAHVEKLIRNSVTSSDWLYGDFTAYYAAKTQAAQVFMPNYLLTSPFRPEEKQRMTVLVVDPKNLSLATNAVGGVWLDTGQGFIPMHRGWKWKIGFLATPNYRLQVYRRAPSPNADQN
jgi:hypothetical protein